MEVTEERGVSIVPVLSCVLNQLCLRNDQHPDHKSISKFHALRPPAITIKDYLNRIAKYASCSGECFVLALVYIDRIIQSNPSFVVNSLNIHRLLITSVMLAAKFFDDQYFNNAYYAKVGGVPCNEINSLEVEFLFMTNFSLFVGTDTYRQYYTELCNHAQNGSCDCTSQRGKIPSLNFPIPDALGELRDTFAQAKPAGGGEGGGERERGGDDSESGTWNPLGGFNSGGVGTGGGYESYGGYRGTDGKEEGGEDGHEGTDGHFYPTANRGSVANVNMTTADSPFVAAAPNAEARSQQQGADSNNGGPRASTTTTAMAF